MSFTRGRLYFSDVSSEERERAERFAIDVLASFGIAATVFRTTGIWDGRIEFGFMLETLDPRHVPTVRIRLEELAELLRAEFQQTSVLVTIEAVNGDAVFVQETNR